MNPLMLYEIPMKPPGLNNCTVGGGDEFEVLQSAVQPLDGVEGGVKSPGASFACCAAVKP